MKIESSTAGRKEDVRDKVTRLKLTALDDDERLFLAALRRAIWDNEPITLGETVWHREPKPEDDAPPVREVELKLGGGTCVRTNPDGSEERLEYSFGYED